MDNVWHRNSVVIFRLLRGVLLYFPYAATLQPRSHIGMPSLRLFCMVESLTEMTSTFKYKTRGDVNTGFSLLRNIYRA